MNAIFAAGEREQLEAMLDAQRAELLATLDGLSEADGRARLVPSATTVLGLVKHATFVETVWFPHRLGGRTRRSLGISERVEPSWVLDPADTVASVRVGYEEAVRTSKEVAARHELTDTVASKHGTTNLRWIYLHMIAELARHAGHADIVVEQLRARVPEDT